jgi:integrase
LASAGIRKTLSGRSKVWWRLDDGSQGSQTFKTKDQARDFKHDLLAQVARGTWVDPRLGKQPFAEWTAEWWETYKADPDRSPSTLAAVETRLRLHILPYFGTRQLRAISVTVVRRWQNELRTKRGRETVMACRSLLYSILQTAEDDRRIERNPVAKVPAPKPEDDPDVLLGRGKRRAFTPEEFGQMLAATSPRFRDHLLCLAGTGLRAGELLGLRADRVDLEARRLEVVSVRYDAGKFGRGYKNRPKTRASIRPVPLAAPVAEAIARQLAAAGGRRALVFAGPGGGNGVPAGTRTALSRYNLRRAYRDAVARISNPTAGLPPTAKRVLKALRQLGSEQSLERVCDWLGAHGRRLRPGTVGAALELLEDAGLATKIAVEVENEQPPRWVAVEPANTARLDGLELHGPHDLRHTFATWLEDAGIPTRVIDELMGHASAQRGRDGSATGPRYRHTTPEMEARAVAAIEQRLTTALRISDSLLGCKP